MKNAHRYYNGDSECNEVKQEVKVDVKEEVMSAKIEVTSNQHSTDNCQLANKMSWFDQNVEVTESYKRTTRPGQKVKTDDGFLS